MPTQRCRRKFATGCRPAPDPYDNFLESKGFYRKHIARDASCLFRTISEQLFDTQGYHEQVRKDCVRFMLKNRSEYEKSVSGNFDEYMAEMAKSKTYGTLLELRAMGLLYKRNILLYQPHDLGTWLIKESDFKKPSLRVFFAVSKHFDSIFTKSSIAKAGFCQGICFELLYKNVFKLPDVEYAVETMLYGAYDWELSNSYLQQKYVYENGYGDIYGSHIVLNDGRQFQLDEPENTYCILDNYHLCHFHNPNFEVNALNTVMITDPYWTEEQTNCIFRTCLPDKRISCVRQLLMEGISPFPYKVAKSIDPDIYRNIEFDMWSDNRKGAKNKKSWYAKNANFQIGLKCLVKIHESQENLYSGYIQEMSPNKGPCVVFIEELGDKQTVPYKYLKPYPEKQAWLPTYQYCFKRNPNDYCDMNGLQYNNKRYSIKRSKKYESAKSDANTYKKGNVNSFECCDESASFDLMQYTDLSNYQLSYPYEIVAMPMTVHRSDRPTMGSGNKSNNRNNNGTVQQQPHQQQQQQVVEKSTMAPTPQPQDESNDANPNSADCAPLQLNSNEIAVPAAGPSGMVQYYYSPYGQPSYDQNAYGGSGEMATTPAIYPIPTGMPYSNAIQVAGSNSAIYAPVPVGIWPNYNPPNSAGGVYNTTMYPPGTGYFVPTSPNPSMPVQSVMQSLPIRRKDLLHSHGRVNLYAQPSYAPSGADLPVADLSTLRFFYNLGHEFFKSLQSNYGTSAIVSVIETDNPYFVSPDAYGQQNDGGERYDGGVSLTNDFQQMAIENRKLDTPNANISNKPKGNDNYYAARRNTSTRNKKDGKPNNNNGGNRSHDRGPSHHNNSKNGPRQHNSGSAVTPDIGKDPKGKFPFFDNGGPGSSYQQRQSSYSPYTQPFMSDNGDQQQQQQPQQPPNSMMPVNIYTSPPYPFGTGNQNVSRPLAGLMPSPCDPTMDNNVDPNSAPFYNQPTGYFYHGAPSMSQPCQNYWYPPTMLPPPPQSSLNSSNVSTGSSNNANNTSNPSQ